MSTVKPVPSILVVEDDADMCLMLASFLRTQGYAVECCASAAEALRVVGASAPPIAAVVSDVRMAPEDGVALLVHLRSTHPRIPVLLFTAAADDGQRRAALAAGAAAYLAKPFPLSHLADALRRALKQKAP